LEAPRLLLVDAAAFAAQCNVNTKIVITNAGLGLSGAFFGNNPTQIPPLTKLVVL
jgi:hypothetical protein